MEAVASHVSLLLAWLLRQEILVLVSSFHKQVPLCQAPVPVIHEPNYTANSWILLTQRVSACVRHEMSKESWLFPKRDHCDYKQTPDWQFQVDFKLAIEEIIFVNYKVGAGSRKASKSKGLMEDIDFYTSH
jgi:hypothetical protein